MQQVAAAEQCPLSPDAVASIAGLADGDIRNALQTLQALFAGHDAAQVRGGACWVGQTVQQLRCSGSYKFKRIEMVPQMRWFRL